MNEIPVLFDEDALLASVCRDDFEEFVREFWECVPGAGVLIWNWHIGVFCEELQKLAERVFDGLPREYDLVFNVPFGTSKSTVISILFPVWVWTRMPEARFLSGTHTDSLALDLAVKSRDVVNSEKYRRLFLGVEIRADRSSKEDFANSRGGERKSCTVGGKTPMGRHAHFIICLSWHSSIMTDRGMLPIGEIVDRKLPVRVLGYSHQHGRAEWRGIDAYECSPGREVMRVGFSNGRELELTGDHPVYVVGRGYVEASKLLPGDEVIHVGGCGEVLPGVWDPSEFSADQDAGEVLRQPVQRQARRQGEVRGEEEAEHAPVRPVREAVLPRSRPSEEKQAQPVFRGVLPCLHDGEQPSPLQLADQELRGLRHGDPGPDGAEGYEQVLQHGVPFLGHGRVGPPEEAEEAAVGVRLLRHQDSEDDAGQGEGEILFQELRQQGPRREDVRRRESELHPRPRQQGVHQCVQKEEEESKEKGELPLFPVRDARGPVGAGPGRASRRLGQGQQPDEQFGGLVQGVPHVSSRPGGQTPQTGTAHVTSVEHGIRIPDKVYNIRVSGTSNYFAEGILVHNCDDPIDPQGARSELELDTAAKFMGEVIPSRAVDKDMTPTILVMQRIHPRDPSWVMLEAAKRPGAVPVRHICLPGELGSESAQVQPPELEARYKDGLLDPRRLSRRTLNSLEAKLGQYAYNAQVRQNPQGRAGSRFKEQWFRQRVRAAPLDCKRVRYWDRAATADGGCYTAGTLIAQDREGKIYVEHCEHGQWEPNERNDRIEATARRDRAKYGKHEPVQVVEAERGSTGLESFQNIARRLAGFRVQEDQPSGSKDVRAEPWSDHLASMNVWLVEDGTWDVEGYIQEHTLFQPDAAVKRLGKYKDRVDSSSGAFNKLVGRRRMPLMRTLSYGTRKKGQLIIYVVEPEDLPALVLPPEETCLLVCVNEPQRPGEEVACGEFGQDCVSVLSAGTQRGRLPEQADGVDGGRSGHGLGPQLASPTLSLEFTGLQPADWQDRWEQPVEPWGLPPAALVMTRGHGKKAWSLLTRRQPKPVTAWVFAAPQDVGVSMALACCEVLGEKPEIISWDGDAVWKGDPPNKHVFQTMKDARSAVM